MLPSMGDIVLYHFDKFELKQSRPAIVLEAVEASVVHLNVFWLDTDKYRVEAMGGIVFQQRIPEAIRHDVYPHCEPTEEVGRVKNMPVAHHTWSWPKSTPWTRR